MTISNRLNSKGKNSSSEGATEEAMKDNVKIEDMGEEATMEKAEPEEIGEEATEVREEAMAATEATKIEARDMAMEEAEVVEEEDVEALLINVRTGKEARFKKEESRLIPNMTTTRTPVTVGLVEGEPYFYNRKEQRKGGYGKYGTGGTTEKNIRDELEMQKEEQ